MCLDLVDRVKVLPPASYPVPEVSLVVEYAVVPALIVADEVYKAILNTCVVSELKSISPFNKDNLKDVHSAVVIAMLSPMSLTQNVAHLDDTYHGVTYHHLML